MRKAIIAGAVLLVFAAVLAAIWLLPAKPRAGPWRLADGSELSLAGVTYGKKHVMHYGNGIADYLYPILSPALRKKFGCKESSINTTDTNAMVIWFWDKGPAWTKGIVTHPPPPYILVTVDEQGMEFAMPFYPNSTVTWRGTNVLQGLVLNAFPRRSEEIGIRIFRSDEPWRTVAEFKIPNRGQRHFPVWTPEPLPATVKTNGLEVTLASFETGLKVPLGSADGLKSGTNYVSQAGFILMENQKRADDYWLVESASATSATGETRDSYAWGRFQGQARLSCRLDFSGTFWAEEPAWKLRVRVSRITNFPPEELWTVKGLEIPARGEIIGSREVTTIYGSEIELMAVSGPRVSFEAVSYVADFPALHVRSPLPAADTHLDVVEIKDDVGRNVPFRIGEAVAGTGHRGATIRELHQSFLLSIPEGAKTLDVTMAYTKSVFVEFMARPTVAKESGVR